MHNDLDLDLKNISKIEGHARSFASRGRFACGWWVASLVGGRRLGQLGGFENA